MQGFDADAFFRLAGRHGHGGLLGMTLTDHGPDWATIALAPQPDFAGPDGGIAAGPVISIMDMATSMAVWARRGRFAPHVTLDLRFDWLGAVAEGETLTGRGECHAIDGQVAFVRGTVTADERPVATVTGTFMLLDGAA